MLCSRCGFAGVWRVRQYRVRFPLQRSNYVCFFAHILYREEQNHKLVFKIMYSKFYWIWSTVRISSGCYSNVPRVDVHVSKPAGAKNCYLSTYVDEKYKRRSIIDFIGIKCLKICTFYMYLPINIILLFRPLHLHSLKTQRDCYKVWLI